MAIRKTQKQQSSSAKTEILINTGADRDQAKNAFEQVKNTVPGDSYKEISRLVIASHGQAAPGTALQQVAEQIKYIADKVGVNSPAELTKIIVEVPGNLDEVIQKVDGKIGLSVEEIIQQAKTSTPAEPEPMPTEEPKELEQKPEQVLTETPKEPEHKQEDGLEPVQMPAEPEPMPTEELKEEPEQKQIAEQTSIKRLMLTKDSVLFLYELCKPNWFFGVKEDTETCGELNDRSYKCEAIQVMMDEYGDNIAQLCDVNDDKVCSWLSKHWSQDNHLEICQAVLGAD